jgi:hypothetical protein
MSMVRAAAKAERARERTVYEAGAGRRTFLSLAFLILLPFYASLPAMLIQRLASGLWFDIVGLMIFSAIFTALMVLLGVQLYQSIRSRVALGDTSVRITLPRGSGAMPMLRFTDTEVPYDQIERVETRCALFGNAMAPVLLRATRLVTKDGRHVRLGNVNEDNIDQALPFPEIGAKIAERAGVEVVDGGIVRRSIERRVLGLIGRKTPPEASPPLTEAEVSDLNRRHSRAMLYLVIVMTVLVAGGIAIDVVTSSRTSFATAGTSGPPAKTK